MLKICLDIWTPNDLKQKNVNYKGLGPIELHKFNIKFCSI